MHIYDIICLIFGIWNVGFGLMMKTKNILSSIVFKVIPMIFGGYITIHAILALGV